MATDNLRGALRKLADDWRHQIDHQVMPDAAETVLRYCHKQVRGLLAGNVETAGAVVDPTHGRIDPDIQATVDEMQPTSLGQRVAIENTLQEDRDRQQAPSCPCGPNGPNEALGVALNETVRGVVIGLRDYSDFEARHSHGALRERHESMRDHYNTLLLDARYRLPEEIKVQRDAGWPDFHPEDYCHRCGNRNMNWWVEGDVWNHVMRPGGAWEEYGIVCPPCFSELAGGVCFQLVPDAKTRSGGALLAAVADGKPELDAAIADAWEAVRPPEFYLTFHSTDVPHQRGPLIHPDGYVVIVAPSFDVAKAVVFYLFGQHWAGLYPGERFWGEPGDDSPIADSYPSGVLLQITVPSGREVDGPQDGGKK